MGVGEVAAADVVVIDGCGVGGGGGVVAGKFVVASVVVLGVVVDEAVDDDAVVKEVIATPCVNKIVHHFFVIRRAFFITLRHKLTSVTFEYVISTFSTQYLFDGRICRTLLASRSMEHQHRSRSIVE